MSSNSAVLGAVAGYLDVVFDVPARGPFTYRTSADAPGDLLGRRVNASFGRRSLTGYVVGSHPTQPPSPFEVKTIERVVDAEPLFDEGYLELARWVSGMYYCSLGEALATMLPSGRRESRLPVFGSEDEALAARHELSEEQNRALEGIFGGGGGGRSYLYGITGSGKTEVYLCAAERTIADGQTAIYLVPEISLTHQLVEAVRHRFNERVAVLHSGLTPSQKYVEWMRIRSGDAQLVIGARSAVFAPTPRLGLIVIDEEHENAYKSGNTPRYHARQVAMRRCAMSNARLVMGSATPSVEAYHLAAEGGLARYTLTQRLAGGTMPAVEVVDMTNEEGALSRRLVESIRQTHDEGRQTILFLNRRGFSYFFHCRSCSFEMTCERCSVALTYHKERNRLLCHYCGLSKKPVEVCPTCGSLDVGYSGFGTELIEEEISRRFPALRIARVDADSIRKKGSLRHILKEFRDGKLDLLLGTQMVAKGLNFPGVKLVGVVLADTGLHLPDFRAEERTFSLIVQVSGRAGRYFPDGKVIIQTYRPANQAIAMAAANDIEGFYRREVDVRRSLRFPPFARLFRLVFRGPDRTKVERTAASFATRVREALDQSAASNNGAGRSADAAEILGPSECPLSLIASNYRRQVIVRTNQFSETHALVTHALAGFKCANGVHIEIDVDPVSLL